jgi:SAM-dependent methyltransferase
MTRNPEESRTPEQLKKHYEIEKELAARLRNASTEERRRLYSAVYDELYRRVPDHPQLTKKSSNEEKTRYVAEQVKLLNRYLGTNTTFLEVGPGDCALSLEIAKRVKQVYAVDVSDEITKGLAAPDNFRLALSDGSSIPVPANSVNVAYSNQLMEHLHPDDAILQLKGIYNALASTGIYICITPNRFTGPHDISRFYDATATGFHLKEYTVSELTNLFRQAGFSKSRVILSARGIYVHSSVRLPIVLEHLLDAVPYPLAKSRFCGRIFRLLLGIRMVGIK